MVNLPDSICNKCSKPASMMCQRCHESYCSTDCQILDWRDHKSKCHQMPNLIPMHKLQLHASPNRSGSISDSIQFDGSTSMRRPHNYMNNNNDMRRQLDNSRRHRDSVGSGDGNQHKNNGNSSKPPQLLDDSAFVLKPKISANNSSSSSKGAIPKTSTSAADTNSDKTVPAWTTPFPPPLGVYFEAIVQFIEEDLGFIWITEAKNDNSLRKLLLEINRNIANEPPCPVEEIQIDSLVSAPLENIYYRAKVLECSAEAKLATVHLIDYGNQLQVQYSQLRAPILIMRKLNAFAFRARMPKDSDTVSQTLEVESTIIIRVLSSSNSKDNGIFDIEFKPKSVPLNLPLRIITSNPEVKVKKIFTDGIHALLQYVNSCTTELDMNVFLNSEQGLKLDFSQPPSEGAFVAARTTQGWRRACLLGCWDKKHIYLVYIIDEGRISLCNQLKKIPAAFLELPMRVFAITVTSPNISLDEINFVNAGKLTLKVLTNTTPPSKMAKSIACAICIDQKEITNAIASTFAGIISELGIKCWTERIADGSIVYITHVLTHAEVFITSASSKDYSTIFNYLATTCPVYKADEEIVKGDIVLASLGDSAIYFRAKILSGDTDINNFKVLDIDTGFSCKVSRSNMRKPNLFIRSCPVYVKKVKIAYIEKIPTSIVNNKAMETLEECQINSVEFIIKYDVCGDNETVDLILKTDEQQSLSKQLLPLIFQARNDKENACTSSNIKQPPIMAEETPLPPSPPDTPIIKDAPAELNIITASASNTASTEAIGALPNLDIKKLSAKKTFTLTDLEIIPISEGDKIPLLVLDPTSANEGYITACDFSNKEFLIKLNDYTALVSKHGKCSHLQRDYEPKPIEICLTIFAEDGEWYRALCMHVLKDGKYRMMFLDYGNVCTVTKQDILPITKDLMFPSNANMCYIDNLPPNLTKEQYEKFVTSCTNGVINCNVKKMEDDNYLIKIHGIEKLLG